MTEPTLTHREFLAVVIRELQNPGQIQCLWLCTDARYQKKALAEADKFYEQWKRQELDAKHRRDAIEFPPELPPKEGQ